MKIRKLLFIFGIFLLIFSFSSCNNNKNDNPIDDKIDDKTDSDEDKDIDPEKEKDKEPEEEPKDEIKYYSVESEFNLRLFDGLVEKHSYKYSDEYFVNDEYANDLIKASFVLQNTNDNTTPNKSIDYDFKVALGEMGYGDFYCNDYLYEGNSIDNIGMLFASKKITIDKKEYTIIAMVLKGYKYNYEWAGNFIVGKTGDHNGFKTPAIKCINELSKYAESIKANDVILWTSGYSRAAAIANLATAYIDNYINYKKTNTWLMSEYKIDKLSFNIDLDNIYCYCFETPAGALKTNRDKIKNITKNIHNYINESDIVPMVLPKDFGFTRYGEEEYFDLSQDSKLANLLNENYKDGYKSEIDEYTCTFEKIDDSDILITKMGDYEIYAHKLDSKISVKEFLKNQIDYLVYNIKNRKNYSEFFDDFLTEAFKKLLEKSDAEIKLFSDTLIAKLKEKNFSDYLYASTLENIIKESFAIINIELSDNAISKIKIIHALVFNMLTKEMTPDENNYFSPRFATFYVNARDIIVNHFPELSYLILNLQ